MQAGFRPAAFSSSASSSKGRNRGPCSFPGRREARFREWRAARARTNRETSRA